MYSKKQRTLSILMLIITLLSSIVPIGPIVDIGAIEEQNNINEVKIKEELTENTEKEPIESIETIGGKKESKDTQETNDLINQDKELQEKIDKLNQNTDNKNTQDIKNNNKLETQEKNKTEEKELQEKSKNEDKEKKDTLYDDYLNNIDKKQEKDKIKEMEEKQIEIIPFDMYMIKSRSKETYDKMFRDVKSGKYMFDDETIFRIGGVKEWLIKNSLIDANDPRKVEFSDKSDIRNNVKLRSLSVPSIATRSTVGLKWVWTTGQNFTGSRYPKQPLKSRLSGVPNLEMNRTDGKGIKRASYAQTSYITLSGSDGYGATTGSDTFCIEQGVALASTAGGVASNYQVSTWDTTHSNMIARIIQNGRYESRKYTYSETQAAIWVYLAGGNSKSNLNNYIPATNQIYARPANYTNVKAILAKAEKDTRDFAPMPIYTRLGSQNAIQGIKPKPKPAPPPTKKVNMTVKKIDAVTKKPIPGVVFEYGLTSDFTGTSVREKTTNSSGIITANGWNAPSDNKGRTVYFREKTTVDGYLQSSKVISQRLYDIPEGGTKVIIFENTPYMDFILTKEDEVTGAKLQGAEFQFSTNSNFTGTTWRGTTNSSGQIRITKVPLTANYIYIRELKAPNGYKVDNTVKTYPINKKVTPGTVGGRMTITNSKDTTFVLTKRDLDSNVLLPNATYEISNYSDMRYATRHTTNSSGQITKTIPSYVNRIYFREVQAPSGYVLDSRIYSVTNTPNSSWRVNHTTYNEKEPENFKTVRIEKYDKTTNTRLQNAAFEIASDRNFTKNKRFGYTNSNGVLTFNDIPANISTMYMREVVAPYGYALDNTVKTLNLGTTPNSTHTFKEYNEKDVVIKLLKTDLDSGDVLEGVEFILGPTYSDVQNETSNSRKYITDSKGMITLSKTELGLGSNVYLKETKPLEGYIKDSKIYNYTIQPNSLNEFIIRKTNTYRPIKNQFKIIKLNSISNLPLEGVEFELSDDSNFTNIIDRFVTDGSGEITFELTSSKEKDYFIRESRPLNDYEINNKVVKLDFEMGYLPGSSSYKEYTFYNTPEHTLGVLGFKLQKMNRTNQNSNVGAVKGPKGIVFEIYRDEGLWDYVGSTTTNSRGEAYFTDILPSDFSGTKVVYYIQETEMPEGYEPVESVTKIEIPVKRNSDGTYSPVNSNIPSFNIYNRLASRLVKLDKGFKLSKDNKVVLKNIIQHIPSAWEYYTVPDFTNFRYDNYSFKLTNKSKGNLSYDSTQLDLGSPSLDLNLNYIPRAKEDDKLLSKYHFNLDFPDTPFFFDDVAYSEGDILTLTETSKYPFFKDIEDKQVKIIDDEVFGGSILYDVELGEELNVLYNEYRPVTLKYTIKKVDEFGNPLENVKFTLKNNAKKYYTRNDMDDMPDDERYPHFIHSSNTLDNEFEKMYPKHKDTINLVTNSEGIATFEVPLYFMMEEVFKYGPIDYPKTIKDANLEQTMFFMQNVIKKPYSDYRGESYFEDLFVLEEVREDNNLIINNRELTKVTNKMMQVYNDTNIYANLVTGKGNRDFTQSKTQNQFTYTLNKDKTIEVENKRKGIYVDKKAAHTKNDYISGASLTGSKLEVREKGTDLLIHKWTVKEGVKEYIPNIDSSKTYYIQETESSLGYGLNPNRVEFSGLISGNATSKTITFENSLSPLIVQKIESKTKDTQTLKDIVKGNKETVKGLNDIKFKIFNSKGQEIRIENPNQTIRVNNSNNIDNRHNIYITGTIDNYYTYNGIETNPTEDSNIVKTSAVNLVNFGGYFNEGITFTDNSFDGLMYILGLPDDVYTFKEIKDTNSEYVNVDENDFIIEYKADTVITSENASANGKENNFYQIRNVIKEKDKNIKLRKINEDKETLESVTFGLFEEGTTTIDIRDSKVEPIETIVSNDKGEVFFENIEVGNYVIAELKTIKGYMLSDELITITEEDFEKETTETIDLGDFINYKIEGEIVDVGSNGTKFVLQIITLLFTLYLIIKRKIKIV